jgi:hypothetical protein
MSRIVERARDMSDRTVIGGQSRSVTVSHLSRRSLPRRSLTLNC